MHLLSDRFEVPFIAQYRMESYHPQLKHEKDDGEKRGGHLWLIMDFHDKWCSFVKKRDDLKNMLELLTDKREFIQSQCGRAPGDEVVEVGDVGADETLLDYAIDRLSTMEEVDDWFQCLTHHKKMDVAKTTLARPRRKQLYDVCVENSLEDLAKRFGLTPSEYGINLERDMIKCPINGEVLAPDDIADTFKNNAFPTPRKCLEGASIVLASDFGHNPRVRKGFRSLMEVKRSDRSIYDCLISTHPTPEGHSNINSHHHLMWGVKALDRKPACKFERDEYLLLLQAKAEKFITVDVEYDEKLTSSLHEELGQLFFDEDGGTDDQTEAGQWNAWRKLVVSRAIDMHLLPMRKKETLAKLETEAREWVVRQVQANLRDRARVDNYRPPEKDIIQDEWPEMSIVMGVCHSEDRDISSALVVLDEHQELKDSMLLGHARRVESYRKGLEDFIKKHMPHVIAVGTSDLGAMELFDDLRDIAKDLKGQGYLPEGLEEMRVVFVNDEIPGIYGASPRAASEFPLAQRLTRQAVGLARYLSDPLQEITNLSVSIDELMCINMHHQQKLIDPYVLVKHLHRELIDTVNAKGCDINDVANHRFRGGQLQFVGGLGPRKAAALRQAILQKGGGSLRKREELITKNILGACVFQNVAGFLLVANLADYGTSHRSLGESRIHPENYQLAIKMAKNALDLEGEDDDDEQCIEDIMHEDHRAKLNDLDLEAYAEALANEGQERKYTLYAIKAELENPAKAPEWISYKEMRKDDIFSALTGEDDNSLEAGRLVMVVVWKVLPRGLVVKHDSGLSGYISIERFSDSFEVGMKPEDFPLNEKIQIKAAINARVVEVNKDALFPAKIDADTGMRGRQGFPLQLTCRTTDLQDTGADQDFTPAFGRHEDYQRAVSKKLPKKKGRQVAMRSIDHPLWHNVTGIEATELLKDSEPGEVIVRPGSGANDLKITWKFAESVYVHINIKEEGREASSTIGTKLSIADSSYDDLDEIIAMYIEPRAELVKDIMSYRKYKDINEDGAEEEMITEKGSNEKSIPYMLSASHEYPGRFVLTYCTRVGSAKREYVMVMQEGYKFRSLIFPKIDQLIQWFKKHYKDPIKKSSSKPGSNASSRNPSRSSSRPASRSSSRPLPGSSRH